MNIGFITDALCDLPAKTIKDYKIHIIPTKVIDKKNIIFDDKSESATQAIYGLVTTDKKTTTDSSSVLEISAYLKSILAEYNYDTIFIITTISTKSQSYINCIEAASTAKSQSIKIRKEKGFNPSPIIEIIDSKQISVGLGALLCEAVKSSDEFLEPKDLLEHIKAYSKHIHTYCVPNDIKKIYSDSKNTQEKDIIPIKAYIGNVLNIKPIISISNDTIEIVDTQVGIKNAVDRAVNKIINDIYEQKILEPFLHIAYSGPMAELKKSKSYLNLLEVAKSKSIKVYKSNVSGTLATHIGTRTFFASFSKK